MPGATAPQIGRGRDGRVRLRFDGWIAGIGTSSGMRVVLGHWVRSPFGPFTDVMIERKDGHRVLLAPSEQTARFVAGTYLFDEVRVVPVGVEAGRGQCTVAAPPLDLRFVTGRRGPMGLLLGAVPGPLAARPSWAVLVAPAARALLGVRTHGSAGGGRYEWYGAKDLRPVIEVRAVYDGEDLGSLAPVEPPVRFGFGSTPRRPCLVSVTTTVAVEESRQAVPVR
ncbi:hypothetical protein ACFW08_34130 [Streptomyces sp. NPDC058960]|uniref:hypothetical protein n=1 Tax=Streptomyces sp. NPDC058960 TaxID=3346679 RepID=UPI003699F50B